MSLFKYKGSKVWSMKFMFHGQLIRESTGTRNKELAGKVERKRRLELEEGRAGISKPKAPETFAVVAKDYLTTEKASLNPKEKGGRASSVRIDVCNVKHHLTPYFGKKLLCDIMPRDIADYQKKRLTAGAAPRTVNMELGTFRSIATESGHWARLVKKIRMLEVNNNIGICLTSTEQAAILEACQMSESRLLYPNVVLQLETGARCGTVKNIPWSEVDFEGRGLRWGKDKTKAGTGRTIPISQRAMAVLEIWAENFPNRKPSHFVFPSERYKQPKDGERGKVSPYITDPSKPVRSLQRSWETALEKAGWILAGRPASAEGVEPFQCRFHDLRHTACTRMIQSGIPIPVIAQLVGWSPSTMMEMARRYGHFSQDTLREAVESISGGVGGILGGTASDAADKSM